MRRIGFLEGFVTITKTWNKLIKGEINVEDLKKTLEEIYRYREKIVKKVKKIKKSPAKKRKKTKKIKKRKRAERRIKT